MDQVEFREAVVRSWCEQRVVSDLEEGTRAGGEPWRVRDAIGQMPKVSGTSSLPAVSDFLGEDASGLVSRLVQAESVPFLAAYRCSASGMDRRADWERVWALQRAEDRGERVLPFDPPPKYDQSDYRDPIYWRLRGKLDVPKERFISYPGCESDEDKERVYGWAGWNHLQRAVALATLYMKRKRDEAWGKERLIPMLAGLDELLPWIWQWHPDATPESGGMKPGQYIADFLNAQCQELGVTVDDLRGWRPESAKRSGAGAARKTSARKQQRAAHSEEEETP